LHSTINQVANAPSASTYTSVRDAGQQNMVHTDAKVHIIHKTYPTRAIRQVMKPYQQSQTTNNNPDTCRNSLIKENIKTMKHLFPNTNNHNDTWKADQGRQLNNNSNIDKNIMNNEIITSKTRFSSYITDLGKPSNGSAISTLTAIVPPIAQLNEEEQLLLTQLDKDIFTVSTPIDIQRLKYITTGHPNKEFISYILDGLTNGFRYNYKNKRHNNIENNLPSIKLNESAFIESINRELTLGRIAGPYKLGNLPVESYRINPCGLVPKRDNQNEFRVIHHHSAPRFDSVNDGINKEDFSTSYENVGHASKRIRTFGKGCLLAKVDIQEAYRILPVHPIDQTLQGFECDGNIYFDRRLAFGNRASAGIFCHFADLLA